MYLVICLTDEFVPSRQRRFYNNSGNAAQAKGDALEIARNFRLQKQKTTTSKVSTVSKAVVKLTTADVPTIKEPGMSVTYVHLYVYMYICMYVGTVRYGTYVCT